MTPELALRHVWMTAQCDPTALRSVSFSGTEPGLPSVYRVGTLASATIAASGLGAAQHRRLRSGRRQRVAGEFPRALGPFRSERYLRTDEGPPPALRDPVMGFYATRDERWIQL